MVPIGVGVFGFFSLEELRHINRSTIKPICRGFVVVVVESLSWDAYFICNCWSLASKAITIYMPLFGCRHWPLNL